MPVRKRYFNIDDDIMKKSLLILTLSALGYSSFNYAAPQRSVSTTPTMAQSIQRLAAEAQSVEKTVASSSNDSTQDSNIPGRRVIANFSEIAPAPGSILLKGTKPEESVDFSVRSDEVITKAVVNLEYTPSPSLIPVQSHLKAYLNDELIGVIPITQELLGKKNQAQLTIDPRYVTDFNKVKLSFIGHYIQVCENPANTTIWLDVSKSSNLDLTYQSLQLKNDLAHFPEPFFDNRDSRVVNIPMVFSAQPSLEQQQAAGILASWFGSQAKWRGQTFPVLYNQLPDRHAVVFATNDKRPAFLSDYPAVTAPTVEMISHPDNPYVKLLIIMGRNDDDLITAAKGIAQGNVIFRGQSVQIDSVKQLAPRQPYDAPNWVRTDKPMTFSELVDYNGQLQANGLQPWPITLNLNLPPDLYLSTSPGIDMRFKYRYTSPHTSDGSRLSISLNDALIQSYPLEPQKREGSGLLRIPILQGLLDDGNDITIPILRLGATNQLRFNFDYSNPIIGGTPERCETYQQIPNYVVIDETSTVDFSGYRHFIAMPDLRAFANASFPYSRLADLSETMLVVNKAPQPAQVSALLNTLGMFGAQIGYPSLQVRITDDWNKAEKADADLLIVGSVPEQLASDDKINLLIDQTKSWVKTPNRQNTIPNMLESVNDAQPDGRTDIRAEGTMAAIIGFESPFYSSRSVVAILADGPHGYQLFGEALNDRNKRGQMFGSAVVVRDSGVSSLRVGETYYVGHIPWWERIWYALATHPVVLALLAVFSVILMAIVLWRVLRYLSGRRLSQDKSI
jgi:hypothetical protein